MRKRRLLRWIGGGMAVMVLLAVLAWNHWLRPTLPPMPTLSSTIQHGTLEHDGHERTYLFYVVVSKDKLHFTAWFEHCYFTTGTDDVMAQCGKRAVRWLARLQHTGRVTLRGRGSRASQRTAYNAPYRPSIARQRPRGALLLLVPVTSTYRTGITGVNKPRNRAPEGQK